MDFFSLPFKGKLMAGDCLYFTGGYHSIPNGCTPWGISKDYYNRFIGDKMGWLCIAYEDGSVDRVPLILGYTLWFRNIWEEDCAPFKSQEAEPHMTALLQDTLYLKGAFEGEKACILCVQAKKGVAVCAVTVEKNPEKEGTPVFTGVAAASGQMDAFFQNHTVLQGDFYPQTVQAKLDEMNAALLTFEEDYANAPVFDYPERDPGFRVRFSGNSLAEIASGVVYHNYFNLVDRVEENGLFPASYTGAPSWRYDGFGPWVPNANSYCGCFYSRDAGRALMTANAFSENPLVSKSLSYANQCMLYFPQNQLKINGKDIPGHYTVIMNKPLVYSKELRYIGWATRYTEDRFGEDCDNLGNQETDGHGLMMMAHYCAWENASDKERFIGEHRQGIEEAIRWIDWCLKNPGVSFAEDGLLYAESEGGMGDYTLYCNVPCCLGLYGYAKIAEYHGWKVEAEQWRAMADRMYQAVMAKLSAGGKWDLRHQGFHHDPVVVMMADIFGYDLRDMPVEWRTLSQRTYEDDMARFRGIVIDGEGGVGYNSAMMTQNALLQDRVVDYSRLVDNLSRICYAPRLPEPYFVPEGISYSNRLKAVRRQGDLANLVQQAEALKTFLIVAGVSPLRNGVLKLMPRLPEGWQVDLQNFKVQNSVHHINLAAAYPENGIQRIDVALEKGFEGKVLIRFGPFERAENITAVLNGEVVSGPPYRSGDAYWLDAEL